MVQAQGNLHRSLTTGNLIYIHELLRYNFKQVVWRAANNAEEQESQPELKQTAPAVIHYDHKPCSCNAKCLLPPNILEIHFAKMQEKKKKLFQEKVNPEHLTITVQ